jgi:hypothetical protein
MGNAGVAFPGRQTFGRKEEAFTKKDHEDRWYF